MALEPKSHCGSRTPITGGADSRVSFSLGSQSWADAESDQRTIPIWFWGQEIDRVPIEITEIKVPKGDVEKNSLQRAVLFRREQFFTQWGRNQLSTSCSQQLRGLHQATKEMQGQEIRLVNDLVEPEEFVLVIIRPLDDSTHFPDHGTGQSASVPRSLVLVAAGAAHWR
jgi:hypothetical protein